MEIKTKFYNRNTSSLTLSQIATELQFDRYVFDPPYQRRGDVWHTEQKAFLIDSIMKNYPIPPIFLETIIDSKTGVSNYNVIDGKQRLLAIRDFINNKVSLPKDFSNDGFGLDCMNSKTMKEVQKLSEKNSEVDEMLSNFWSYVITIEYISRPSAKIIENIFDRINRGGNKLNSTEMLKSHIYNTKFYDQIEEIRTLKVTQKVFANVNISRLEDLEILIDLGVYYLKGKISTSNEGKLTKDIKQFDDTISNKYDGMKEKLIATLTFIEKMKIDFNEYKLSSTGHFLAICIFSLIVNDKITSKTASEKLINFYTQMREDYSDNDETLTYFKSMQAGTKQIGNRKTRVNSLLEYSNLPYRVK